MLIRIHQYYASIKYEYTSINIIYKILIFDTRFTNKITINSDYKINSKIYRPVKQLQNYYF